MTTVCASTPWTHYSGRSMPDQAPATAAQKVTIIQHVASPGQVHYARWWGGQWVARCDASAGWTVPLIHHPKRADLITCDTCRFLRMDDIGAVQEAAAFMERVRND